ncbi:MAG: ABC transporter substrate-binding protein [Deltaproteobacteria bacterium]|nr:ABC transporter substrate-binding protein [Deltaproteobacteria bacterium]
MDQIKFPYRSARHLALLHVVAESGAWKNQGLSVEYDFYVDPHEAHDLLRKGKVQFVGGNHITPYIKRSQGDNWTYVGQTANYIAQSIVVKKNSRIGRLQDLKGKSLAVGGGGGPHAWLNAWLILEKAGLNGTVKLNRIFKKGPAWRSVQTGDEIAALVNRPDDLVAEREGLKAIHLPLLPMIVFTTVSTTAPFVRENGELVKRFLKGLGGGIKFFKTDKKKAMEILNSTLPKEKGGGDKEMIQYIYRDLTETLTDTLYPTMDAINNVYAEACRYNSLAKKVNPLELWDLHLLRQLRDDGEI